MADRLRAIAGDIGGGGARQADCERWAQSLRDIAADVDTAVAAAHPSLRDTLAADLYASRAVVFVPTYNTAGEADAHRARGRALAKACVETACYLADALHEAGQ